VSDAGCTTQGSGLPVPRRRTFAQGILPFAHSDAAFASPSWLRSAAYAGSRGTGSPELSPCSIKAQWLYGLNRPECTPRPSSMQRPQVRCIDAHRL
jgi:hypothetical protein